MHADRWWDHRRDCTNGYWLYMNGNTFVQKHDLAFLIEWPLVHNYLLSLRVLLVKVTD
jgi:hypothetical protein